MVFSSGSPPEWVQSFGVEGAVFVPKPCAEAALLVAVDAVAGGRAGSPAQEVMRLESIRLA